MIVLVTDNGSVELHPADGSRDCVACNTKGGGMVDLTIHDVKREWPDVISMCGNCVMVGLGGVLEGVPQ